jgi:hypothetical protein
VKDLKLTKEDKKEEEKSWQSPSEDDYPYGLSLQLEESSIKKLGINQQDYDVDQEVTFAAKALVSSISENKNQNATRRSMSLQIIAMELKPEEVDPASTMYKES